MTDPVDDLKRRADELREDFRAWCAWQVRVPFTYANGQVEHRVNVTDWNELHLLAPRLIVTPPPEVRR
jgi:hypothetical protein